MCSAKVLHARAFVAALLLLGAFLAACSSDRSALVTTSGALTTAVTLAARDERLGALLVARAKGEGWEKDGDHFTSPGFRGSAEKRWSELGARLPARADAAFEVGVSQFSAQRLRLTPRDAEGAKAELRDGHVVYAAAYGSDVDLVMTTTRDSMEQLLVLRAPTAPVAFGWDVELSAGIARGSLRADGSLRFEDARGEHVMHVPSPYAIDARGVRREAQLSWDGDAHLLGVKLDASGLAFPVLLDPAFEVAVWEQAVEPARGEHAMAYHSTRKEVVLFGGRAPLYSNDTWTWNGTRWHPAALSTLTPPQARAHHAMAEDAARGCVVLFGGNGVGGMDLDDTWTWDGSMWSLVSPALSPPARRDHAMAYDAARGRVVLFGGTTKVGSAFADTWTWNGSSWTKMQPTTSPPARANHAMGYDETRGQVVLFGGSGPTALDDTWTWDGTNWTKLSPAVSPPARGLHSMAYDQIRGRTVLFGGRAAVDFNDTWTWDGATWTQAAPATSPTARPYAAMAYDATRGRTVLFGGIPTGARGRSETWTWDGTMWVQAASPVSPIARESAKLAYDTARARVVLFGGRSTDVFLNDTFLNDTWTWNGAKWAQALPATSPPVRTAHALAYDEARARVVLFGGNDELGGVRADTWTWDGTTWTNAAPATSPPARAGQAMVYDVARDRVVLFGGTSPSSVALNDTWTWDGTTWAQQSPATSPLARSMHAMAYDAARGRVLIFGGHNQTLLGLSDTWTWDGTTWTQLLPAVVPPLRTGAGMAYDASRRRVVLFGGRSYNTGLLDDTWTWDGALWAQSITTAPPRERFASLAYDTARNRIVVFSGTNGGLDDTWLYHARGGSCTLGSDCGSGFCVDSVCCETSSCGICQACDGTVPGVCSPLKNAPDPGSCSGMQSCDAQGACRPSLGQTCSKGAECASGFCVDGVCCDTACRGFCQTCAGKLNESGIDGTCGPAKSGVDPHDDCAEDGSATCQRDGLCEGTGRCRLYVQGAVCAPATCLANRTTARTCDGMGTCGNSATGTECAPYACASGACATSCAGDVECAAHFRCDAATHTCISTENASCDGDHTLVAPDGTRTECAPYKCAGTACVATCTSVLECAFPNECAAADHTCVPPSAGNDGSSSGCACRTAAPGARTPGYGIAGATALLLLALRRRRREQTYGRLV